MGLLIDVLYVMEVKFLEFLFKNSIDRCVRLDLQAFMYLGAFGDFWVYLVRMIWFG